MPISALRTGAGGDHIAHAREPCKGLRATTQCSAQSGDLSETACNECGSGIVTGAKTVSQTYRKRNDIFEDTTQLASNHVVVSIDTKQTDVEHGLQPVGRGIIKSKYTRCGFSFEYLPSKIGPRQHSDGVIGTALINDFGHTFLCRGLETLRHTDDGCATRNQRRHLFKHTTKVVRGNCHKNCVGVGHGLCETSRCRQKGVEIETFEVPTMRMRAINLIHDVLIARPQRDVSIPTNQRSQCRAP